jgi:hypothetical protein
LLAFICNDGGVSDADDNFGLKMLWDIILLRIVYLKKIQIMDLHGIVKKNVWMS